MRRFLMHPGLVFTATVWAFVLGAHPGDLLAMPSSSLAVSETGGSYRQAQIDKIVGVLSHPRAQIQLRAAGIPPAQLRHHLNRLDDAQLAQVAQKADQVKAGGILGVVIALLVIAILVVILLWMLGKDVDVDVKDK